MHLELRILIEFTSKCGRDTFHLLRHEKTLTPFLTLGGNGHLIILSRVLCCSFLTETYSLTGFMGIESNLHTPTPPKPLEKEKTTTRRLREEWEEDNLWKGLSSSS